MEESRIPWVSKEGRRYLMRQAAAGRSFTGEAGAIDGLKSEDAGSEVSTKPSAIQV
jgi:hypothetical protein